MSIRLLLFALLPCGFGIESSWGRDLLVPQEYETITAALQDLGHDDTISVSPGVYMESLVAPALSFTMRGTVPIDSLSTDFSILDPSELPGSDTLLTVRLTAGNACFEDLVFRNRAHMIEGRLQSDPSGIKGDTLVESVRFERCIFDSLVGAVTRVDMIVVSNSRFIGCLGAVFTGSWRGTLRANNTWFDGLGGLIDTQDGCEIRDCTLSHAGPTQILIGVGDSLIIERCRFVGRGHLSFSALQIRPRCGSSLSNCVFQDIEVRNGAVVEVLDSCSQITECAIKVQGNRFVRCGAPIGGGQGGAMLRLRCNNPSSGYIGTLLDNEIDSTGLIYSNASGIETDAGCRIEGTAFGDALTPNKPQIFVEGRGRWDTLVFRNNSFSRFFTGIEFLWDAVSEVDARENWWGDASGPYHGSLNPNGSGAGVDHHVQFIPWLTSDPDSSDTSSVAPERETAAELNSFRLSAYPNPFNNVVTLQLEVSANGQYILLLFDLTGREVRKLFQGTVNGTHNIRFDAHNLPSGIYFAQLRNSHAALATTKLLLLK